jgi:hypothetical protein
VASRDPAIELGKCRLVWSGFADKIGSVSRRGKKNYHLPEEDEAGQKIGVSIDASP